MHAPGDGCAFGSLERAKFLFQASVKGREKIHGKDHPSTSASVHNLAQVLHDQEEMKAAESLFQRALDGLERTLGKTHPDTLCCANKLANFYFKQECYEDVETIY